MPPNPRDTQARADAVRNVVTYIRQTPEAVIGLTPEGRDILEETLGWPPAGAGRFMFQLTKLGLKLSPLGVYEADGCFWLHFGPVFELDLPPALARDELDRCASRQVMEHIARLVPERMRGAFGGTDGRTFDRA